MEDSEMESTLWSQLVMLAVGSVELGGGLERNRRAGEFRGHQLDPCQLSQRDLASTAESISSHSPLLLYVL